MEVQNQKGWEDVTVRKCTNTAHHSLPRLIHAYPLTTTFGGFLLYWVYIFSSIFINQYNLIYKVQKINFLWCLKVTVEYCKQGNGSFSQTLQAQSGASGKPGDIWSSSNKNCWLEIFHSRNPIYHFLFLQPLLLSPRNTPGITHVTAMELLSDTASPPLAVPH